MFGTQGSKNGRWAAGALLLALIGGAQAQITKQGAGYLFRAKYAAGSTLRYIVVANGSVKGTPFELTIPSKMKVLGVKNGITSLRYDAGPMTMKLKGKPINTGPA